MGQNPPTLHFTRIRANRTIRRQGIGEPGRQVGRESGGQVGKKQVRKESGGQTCKLADRQALKKY